MSVEVKGDYVKSHATMIVHIANSVTEKAQGISAELFQLYPYADIYERRKRLKCKDKVGSVLISCPTGVAKTSQLGEKPVIIHIVSQKYPGPSKWDNDSQEKRLDWFKEGIDRIKLFPACYDKSQSLAFPGFLHPDMLEEVEALAEDLPIDTYVYKS